MMIEGYDPLKDPYLDDRLRSEKSTNYLGFIDELRKLWKLSGNTSKIVRNQPIGDDAEFPSITFTMVHRKVSEAHKDLKRRLRGTVRHPYHKEEFVEIYGQVFELKVQFTIYALSAEEADDIASEFEDFIENYKGHFMKNGVAGIRFAEQLTDTITNPNRVAIVTRPLLYTMYFEKITPVMLDRINQVLAKAEIVKDEQV